MKNSKFLLNELTKQNKQIFISGTTLNTTLIYIKNNEKDHSNKVYLFKTYFDDNAGEYGNITIEEPPMELIGKINRLKKVKFYNPTIKTISTELITLFEFDYFYGKLTINKAYNITECLIQSLTIDLNRKQKDIIKEIKNNKFIMMTLYEKEILNI